MKIDQLALNFSAAPVATTLDVSWELPPGAPITAQHAVALHRMTADELEAFRQRQAKLYAHLPRASHLLDTRWGLQRRRR